MRLLTLPLPSEGPAGVGVGGSRSPAPQASAPGVVRDSHAGRPGPGGEARGQGRGLGSERGRPGVRGPAGGRSPPPAAAPEAPAPERQAGSRPGAGDGGGGRQRAWPEPAGPGASLAEGGLARSEFRGFRRDHSPERGGARRVGAGRKKPAVQCAGFLDGQDRA